MKNKDFSDEKLLHSLKKGEEVAITEIYNRYWQKLLAIAYNHTGEKQSAEEIVQEVLVNLWNRREAVNIISLPNYLATAVKYAVLYQLSIQKRRKNIVLRIFGGPQEDLSHEKIYAGFLQADINGAVDKLPEKCRLVFKSSREQGKTIAEISKEFGIAEKTAEAHLTKALKSLRYTLKNAGVFTFFLISTFLR